MFSKYIKPNLITATAYIIGGYIGLLLFVVPPSNAAAIWPASGIALAMVLIFGYRVLPGVFIANFILETLFFLDTSGVREIISTTTLVALIATGATCQAWAGAKIVDLITNNDEALLKERSILLFTILAGLVSSTVSASIAVFAMWYFDVLTANELLLSWFTWWTGDSVGILVFTPLLLCFFGKPRYFWKQRIITVALPLLFLSFISFIIFRISFLHELKYLEEVFEINSYHFSHNLEDTIESHMNSTLELKEFYDSSDEVLEEEFSSYVRPKLSRLTGIKALEWIAVVAHKDREKFESETGKRIKIPYKDGNMRVSPVMGFYYVIKYLEPLQGNENAYGYDIRHNTYAREAAETACATGNITVTDAIKIVQEEKEQLSVVFYAPVYKKSDSKHINVECSNIEGFAASVFQLEQEINNIHNKLPGLELLVELKSGSKTIYRDADYKIPEQFNTDFKKTYRFPVANQQYEISFVPTSSFFTQYSSWAIWLILVSGILISGLFGIGLLMLTGRALRTEELVQLRTGELNNEVIEGKHKTKLLTLENKYLEMIAQDYSLRQIADSICIDIETIIPNSYCAIRVIDLTEKFLICLSAPNLPEEFRKIKETLNTESDANGNADYLHKQINVIDIENDPLWADFHKTTTTYDITTSWTTPICVQNNNKFLGTFSIYFSESKEPDTEVIEIVQRITNLFAVAILHKQSEDKLNFHASHDALTGLVNRREFERRVQRIFDSVRQDKDEYAVCFLDLDQFKIVNDTCGHVAGDELLRQLTTVLENAVRKRDTLARLGGDEFGVLMEHCSLKDANRVAKSILNAIQNYQFVWEEHTFKIGISIGLVPITQASSNFHQLLKDADAACYMAKELGRNRIHVYSEDDENLAKRSGEVQWITHINSALEGDLFNLYAQAIVPLDNSKEYHYELLVRMHNVNGDLFPPGAFLPAAERYNLITQIDHWVIKNAFTLLVNNPVFLNDISFCSINLSGQTLSSPEMLNFISSQLKESKIQGHKICFEVTETAAISNLSVAIEFISTLKGMGCRFALDDFGSGFSSFAYLKNLPVDYLKIDGIFVKDIADDPIDHAMVKSINEIGQVMGMETIAEFVENDVIKGMLKEIGVNYAQGYGIGKPQPFDEILKNHKK